MNLPYGFASLILSFLYLTIAFWYVRTPYFLITRNAITVFCNVLKRPKVIAWDDVQNTFLNMGKKRIYLHILDDGVVEIRMSELDRESEDTLLRILPTVFPSVESYVG